METAKPTPMENRVMKEIPILFSTPMVQAILDGRKTMTRRIVKLPDTAYPNNWISNLEIHNLICTFYNTVNDREAPIKCPYGKPGDRLWVRESFGIGRSSGLFYYKIYAYDPQPSVIRNHKSFFDKWKPSIHMPKSACRIWLEVVSVRVERLQEITEQDAIKEGIEIRHNMKYADRNDATGYKDYLSDLWYMNPIDSIESLWRSINGPDSWNANPWVWVVEFKRITKN